MHPHPLLHRKLTEAPGVSILDQVGQGSGRGTGGTSTLGSRAKMKRHVCETRDPTRTVSGRTSGRETMREEAGLSFEPCKCHTCLSHVP